MKTAIYLLSNDLRLDDNAILHAALDCDSLLIVYCLDPAWLSVNRYGLSSLGHKRFQFLKASLLNLADRYESLGQRVHIHLGETVESVRQLVTAVKADAVLTARPSGWYERNALYEIAQRFQHLSVQYFDHHTLFSHTDGDWLHDELPRQYTPFRKLAETKTVSAPLDAPTRLPPPPQCDTSPFEAISPNRIEQFESAVLRHAKRSNSQGQSELQGGEDQAIRHLREYFASDAPASYKLTRNALDGWTNSSKWSCWLAHGCVSPRRIWQAIEHYEKDKVANESTHWLKVELLWREYFQWLARQLGTQLFSFKGLRSQAPLSSFYAERFKRWCEGNTPYPLVNACMLELLSTGYMSNRGRQIVASCLVNEYQIDWRYGAAWFEHHLIDYDVGSNWGNWQYIAGVGVDPRGGRHFDIAKQQNRYDPEQAYIKRWLGQDYLQNTPKHSDSVDAADWPIS